MNRHTAKIALRCQHRTPAGRQCRARSSGAASRLCAAHSAVEKQLDSADLAVALDASGDTFQSAEGINRSLSELFALLAKNRVSPRRAAVLAYIGSLLLRTLPAIEKELNPEDPKKSAPTIIWDLPCPPHEQRDQAS